MIFVLGYDEDENSFMSLELIREDGGEKKGERVS